MAPQRGDMAGTAIHPLLSQFVAAFTAVKVAINSQTSPAPTFNLTLEISSSTPAKTA
jgi:hypothetical protein